MCISGGPIKLFPQKWKRSMMANIKTWTWGASFLHNILLWVVIVFFFLICLADRGTTGVPGFCPDPSLFMCMLWVCLWVWACFLRFILWSSTWLRAESSYALIGQLFTLFCRPTLDALYFGSCLFAARYALNSKVNIVSCPPPSC